MASIADIKGLFDEWIAAVARAIDSVVDRYRRRPRIVLRENDNHVFTATLEPARKGPALPDISFRLADGRPEPSLRVDWVAAFRGSQVEALLAPGQVLFRTLDFPKQAVDFLDGMIRTQIDRLTPWAADEVVFGWNPPSSTPDDRLELTLAATSKQQIQPLLQLAAGMAAASLTAFAVSPAVNGTPAKIRVFDQPIRGAMGWTRDLPRVLRLILLAVGLAAAVTTMVSAYVGGNLESELQQLTRRISDRRVALRLNPNGGSALGLLARRKQTGTSDVVVLEALSQALPDGTYVTELRIEGDKVQIVGMTQDAPSLIRLIERSPQFSRATFFAPTTRAPNESGERFHIEAHIGASFGSST